MLFTSIFHPEISIYIYIYIFFNTIFSEIFNFEEENDFTRFIHNVILCIIF